MLNQYIQMLKPQIETIFSDEASGHDIYHLERTMKMALILQKNEGGDKDIIGVSAYLHDLHRLLSNQQGKYCSPNESMWLLQKLLNDIKFPYNKIDKVMKSVANHEVYNWNDSDNCKSDIETLILQDADNLDAIGAIGIARTFMFSGAKGISMYDPKIPIVFGEDYSEDNGNDPSSVHHIHHKLLRLGVHMNTDTAKLMARDRISLMKNFVDSFINEWNC